MKRRRFLRVAATAGLIAASPARAFPLRPVEWRGTALGVPASLTIHHEDRALALRLLAECRAEIGRLEAIFSLYRADSALTRLNRDGILAEPPLDMVMLFAAADRFWRQSHGAFDPTVQPLWDLHARHFAQAGADPAGPPAEAVERARATIGWNRIAVDGEAIRLGGPGMAVTMNGIAQGYVTDRIAELLRRAGLGHVLVDMGEIAALGPRGDGRGWSVGLPGGTTIRMDKGALAVSDGGGTRFSPACHHIFDPRSGRSPTARVVAIRAATATAADAISTAIAAGADPGYFSDAWGN